jgi:hypothetical protein
MLRRIDRPPKRYDRRRLRSRTVAAVLLLATTLAGCEFTNSADEQVRPHPRADVGAFPEPLLHGSGGRRYPVVLECAPGAGGACAEVAARLAAAGVLAARQALGTGVGKDTLRVLVGPWRELRGDVALSQIDRGPRASGVFARFTADGTRLRLLDTRARTARTLGPGAGLIAATRFAEQAPTWAVTGTDANGVRAAAGALDPGRLTSYRALAVAPGAGDLPVPRAGR